MGWRQLVPIGYTPDGPDQPGDPNPWGSQDLLAALNDGSDETSVRLGTYWHVLLKVHYDPADFAGATDVRIVLRWSVVPVVGLTTPMLKYRATLSDAPVDAFEANGTTTFHTAIETFAWTATADPDASQNSPPAPPSGTGLSAPWLQGGIDAATFTAGLAAADSVTLRLFPDTFAPSDGRAFPDTYESLLYAAEVWVQGGRNRPHLRQYPRSPLRKWPPERSVQRSLRQGPGAYK